MANLGVNPNTIYQWITRENMPDHKRGRLWKFLASEVDQWGKGGYAAENAATTPGSMTKPRELQL